MSSQKAVLELSNITGRMIALKLAMLLLSYLVIAYFLWSRTQNLSVARRKVNILVYPITCFLTSIPYSFSMTEAFIGAVSSCGSSSACPPLTACCEYAVM